MYQQTVYNIHLVFTIHKPTGNCDSYELCNIIESIRPEIILEELSELQFRQSYQEERLITLETNAVKMYLANHDVEHMPVDTFERPKLYDENMDHLFDKVIMGGSRKSADLRGFIDSRQSAISRYGFNFLNSKYNDEAHMQYVGLKDEILKLKNDERLFQLDQLNDEVLGKQEDVMLKNIYDYSSRHEYGTALFLAIIPQCFRRLNSSTSTRSGN